MIHHEIMWLSSKNGYQWMHYCKTKGYNNLKLCETIWNAVIFYVETMGYNKNNLKQ